MAASLLRDTGRGDFREDCRFRRCHEMEGFELVGRHDTAGENISDGNRGKSGSYLRLKLSLQDRRVMNVLYANSGTKICDDTSHVIGIAELRGAHKGGE